MKYIDSIQPRREKKYCVRIGDRVFSQKEVDLIGLEHLKLMTKIEENHILHLQNILI
jgi:hypothetical protein